MASRVQSIVDKHKQSMTDASYLEICNALKDQYEDDLHEVEVCGYIQTSLSTVHEDEDGESHVETQTKALEICLLCKPIATYESFEKMSDLLLKGLYSKYWFFDTTDQLKQFPKVFNSKNQPPVIVTSVKPVFNKKRKCKCVL